jgi:hypothetical protein
MKKLIAIVLLATFASSAAMAAGQVTYKYPTKQDALNGQQAAIFLTQDNGAQFCKEARGVQGDRMVAAEMVCGEDESAYIEFNRSTLQWRLKSTGSKNQCYPLFKEITCSEQ